MALTEYYELNGMALKNVCFDTINKPSKVKLSTSEHLRLVSLLSVGALHVVEKEIKKKDATIAQLIFLGVFKNGDQKI
jgi:hypothetical protein